MTSLADLVRGAAATMPITPAVDIAFTPGTISGFGVHGVELLGRHQTNKARIENVRLVDNASQGFEGSLTKVRLHDVEVSGNLEGGVQCASTCKLNITDSMIVGNGTGLGDPGVRCNCPIRIKLSVVANTGDDGLTGTPVRVKDCAFIDNGGAGLAAPDHDDAGGASRVIHSTFSGNRQGFVSLSERTIVRDSTFTNNGVALTYWGNGSMRVKRTSVTASATVGALGELGSCRVMLIDSQLTGNGTSATCGDTEACADVAACVAPVIRATTCETSHDTTGPIDASWGVCSLD
jgi:hypothetical protein